MSRCRLIVATSIKCHDIIIKNYNNVTILDLSIQVETLQSSVATSIQCHNINSMSQHRKDNFATSKLIYNTKSQCRDINMTLTYHWKLRIAQQIFNVVTSNVTHDIDNFDVATSPRHQQLGQHFWTFRNT